MNWNPIWEEIFSSQEWGKYPGEPLIRFVAKNFYKLNRSEFKILELGCGPGANLWFCAREGFNVFGIDGSNKAIEICIRRLDQEVPGWRGEIINGSVTNLPFQNSFFDAVIDNQCISCLDFESAMKAYDEYYKLATEYNITMVQLAQAFVNSRPFVTSNIIGATTMDQLKENIKSIDIELTDEIMDKINLIHNNNPNPSP